MTDTSASISSTPSTRRPSGAAVAGAYPRPKLYPRQIVVMASDELAERLASDAAAAGRSKSDIARGYLEAGIAAVDAERATESAAGRLS